MVGQGNRRTRQSEIDGTTEATESRYFREAQILVVRPPGLQTVVSAARGGVFKHFGDGPAVTDAGLILETASGRLAASQWHNLDRQTTLTGQPLSFTVAGPLYWCRTDLATPLAQSLLHLGMMLAGRWCRTLVRRLLQRRLITGRRAAPIRLTRTFTWLPLFTQGRGEVREPAKDEPFSADGLTEPPNDPGSCATGSASACATGSASACVGALLPRIEAGTGKASGTLGWALQVTDLIELCDPRLTVRRMAFGTDHQMAYVAASGVYQESVLRPWTDLAEKVEELNARRRVVVERDF
jgi:hypothetical protein